MDPNDDDRMASQNMAADASAEEALFPCSSSDGSSTAGPASSTGNGKAGDVTHFQAELLSHVQTGNRGLEAALRLLCERLLDLEGCWERTQEVGLRGLIVRSVRSSEAPFSAMCRFAGVTVGRKLAHVISCRLIKEYWYI